jgi:hypothetical protein
VAGMPRSGTSWVGRTITRALDAAYRHEPFNIAAAPCSCGVTLDRWFLYVDQVTRVRTAGISTTFSIRRSIAIGSYAPCGTA